MSKKDVTGIILAGGNSKRMGIDKGMIDWQGKPFTAHIIEALQNVANDIIIIANNPDYEKFKLKVYKDLIPGMGPLGGISTGLHYSNTLENLVVACDTPFVNKYFLRTILSSSMGFDVCITSSEGKWEPLVGYYNRNCLKPFNEQIAKGELKMSTAIEQVNHKVIALDQATSVLSLKNFNTPDDLNAIK